MKKEIDIEEIKLDSYLEGIWEERNRVAGVIQYIISKNSYSVEDEWDREVKHKELYEDLQELSQYLKRRIRENNKK